MLQELYNSNTLIYIIVALGIVGAATKLITGTVYQRTLRASRNIGETSNKWIKQIILRFEAAYQLKINVNNVDKFVDKYVYKRKFMWIYLYTWEGICGQMLLLSLLIGTIGSFVAFIADCGQTAILYTLAVGVLSAGVLIFLEVFINTGQKKQIIKTNIEDYLENYLKVKLEYEIFAPDELEKYQREYFDERSESGKEERKEERRRRNTEKKEEPAFSTAAAKEQIVTEVLEEFFL